MTNKEFLEELKAKEELIARGWIQVPCGKCNGKGWYSTQDSCGYGIARTCYRCEGKGEVWQAPIRKSYSNDLIEPI